MFPARNLQKTLKKPGISQPIQKDTIRHVEFQARPQGEGPRLHVPCARRPNGLSAFSRFNGELVENIWDIIGIEWDISCDNHG